ncbi:MAG TPA: hypothetical protein PLV92_00500, partial [Pirellulaceae bacterium]|nr:hypothetical protein [Pirellulaceae bacterium]
GKGPGEMDELALKQSRLADKYARLEELMARMATFEATTNPRRAQLLKQAVAQSKDKLTLSQLNQIVKLLNQNSLDRALEGENTAQTELKALLELLQSENRADRLKSEQARIKEYIKEVERILRLEKSIQGRTESGQDAKDLSKEQNQIADRTGDLAKKIQENEEGGSQQKSDGEGKDSEGKPGDKNSDKPSDPPGEKPDAKSGDKPNDKPGDMGEGKPGEKSDGKPGDKSSGKPGDKQSGKPDGKGDQKPSDKPGEKSGEKPGDKPGEKPDSKPGEKTEGKPSDSKPSDSKPSEGKPSDSKPGDSKPSDSKPSDSKPSDSKPSDSKSGDSKPGDSKSGDSKQSKSKPSSKDQQPPNPARQRIQAAEEKMKEAERKLAEAKRKEAIEEQEKAKEELEKAKAELERILRQMREEELERTLAMLEGRFRKMLEMELRVYESTKRLDRIPKAERGDDVRVLSGRIAFDQRKIGIEADKALTLLREEGSSIAFPETVEQVRDDMEQVSNRLDQTEVGSITQGIEEDIIAALEEIIEALQKAQQDLDKQQQPPQDQPPGQPQDQPLVDKIAELKMIRSLQMRINGRTKRYARLLDNADDPIGQAQDAEVREAITKLGEKQEQLQRVTRDIVLGKNK